jgi:hypothetical protein
LDTRGRWRLPSVGLGGLILAGIFGHAQALALQDVAEDARALLQLAGKAEPAEARQILGKVVRMLADDKANVPAGERERLAAPFVTRLAEVVSTPKHLDEVMGPKSRPTVARQVWYRRYREQWTFDFPFRFTVLVDFKKGEEPGIRSVRQTSPEQAP